MLAYMVEDHCISEAYTMSLSTRMFFCATRKTVFRCINDMQTHTLPNDEAGRTISRRRYGV
jgi:hypothetical protein